MPHQETAAKGTRRRPLPTVRVTVSDQMTLAHTVGLMCEPFSTHDIAARTGIPAVRVGLAMNFFVECVLVTKALGRGMYCATPAARRVAVAWAQDPELGKAELRKTMSPTWFVKCARAKLAAGPGSREGLRARFIVLAGGGATEHRSVDKLIELMSSLGLLVEEPDGLLRWFENAPSQVPEEPTDSHEDAEEAEDEPREHPNTSQSPPPRTEDDSDAPTDEPSAEEHEQTTGSRSAADDSTGPGPREARDGDRVTSVEEVAQLLSNPIPLGYLRHMTLSDAQELRRSLRTFVSILTAARDHAEADDEPAQPGYHLHLPELERSDEKTWLALYASARETTDLISALRSRQPSN